MIKIIVTDDQILFRRGVITSLANKPDISVIAEAENGKDLLHKLSDIQPDIIILNITMPVMNGKETLPILKKEYPDIKVIILSMHNSPAIIYNMMELGANAYLTKECNSEEIYDAIKGCYANGFYVLNLLKKYLLGETPKPSNELSNKEIQTVKLLSEGRSKSEIATELGYSPKTMEAIIGKLMTKTGTKSLRRLIKYARVKKII